MAAGGPRSAGSTARSRSWLLIVGACRIGCCHHGLHTAVREIPSTSRAERLVALGGQGARTIQAPHGGSPASGRGRRAAAAVSSRWGFPQCGGYRQRLARLQPGFYLRQPFPRHRQRRTPAALHLVPPPAGAPPAPGRCSRAAGSRRGQPCLPAPCQRPTPPLPRAPGPIPPRWNAVSQPKHSPAQPVRAPPREAWRAPTGARAEAPSCPAVPPTRGGPPATAPRSPSAPAGPLRPAALRAVPCRAVPGAGSAGAHRPPPLPPLYGGRPGARSGGSGAPRPPPSPASRRAFPSRSPEREGRKEGKQAAPQALPAPVPPRAAPRLHDVQRLRDGDGAGEGWTPGNGWLNLPPRPPLGAEWDPVRLKAVFPQHLHLPGR